jgi:NADH dehydrogenase FAD-containing subunit
MHFSSSILLSYIADLEVLQVTQFDFTLASAESVDVEAKKVTVSGPTGKQTLGYDFLVLATGSRAKGDAPFKGVGSTEDTKAARHDFQARVKKAKTIAVAGGGVTGCETAGELAYEYGRQKEIIFVRVSPSFWSSSQSPSVTTTLLSRGSDITDPFRSQMEQNFSKQPHRPCPPTLLESCEI